MVNEGKPPLPGDNEELYRFLMRGAHPDLEMEAAARLAFRAEALRGWLLCNGFIEAREGMEGTVTSRPHACILFEEALERVVEVIRSGHVDDPLVGPGSSGFVVLAVAADLAGVGKGGYWRGRLIDLESDDARHVAEAMMYGAGCLDGTADPEGNSSDGGFGPDVSDYNSRISGDY